LNRDPTYRRRRAGLILVLCTVLIVAFGTGVAYWWWSDGRWTTQPAVAGLDEASARAALAAGGFDETAVEFTLEYSETVAPGIVIACQPGDGARIQKDATVACAVSQGPERYTVATVTGLTVDAAKAALLETCTAPEDEKAAKCPALGTVEEVWSDEVEAGLITVQGVEAGAAVAPGTVVDIQVSKGREPVEIPDYTGQAVADAQPALEALQFAVAVTEEHSATVAEGLVIRQEPASGTGYHGDTITLVKSLGPVMVEVPNVVLMTEDKAKATLTQAGLVPVVEGEGGYIILHIVRSQDPKAGTVVPEGTTVTLKVA
jgi:serine/threonine-protein kinase